MRHRSAQDNGQLHPRVLDRTSSSPPRTPRPASPSGPGITPSFEGQCVGLLFGILAASGLPVARLREVASQVCDGLKSSRRAWNAADLAYFARLPHILSLWHLVKGYVNSKAQPRQIPLHGSGPSLAKLIARVFPRADPEEVLETLVYLGAVQRRGRFWLPCGRNLVFQAPRIARLGILVDVARFLGTAQHNLTHTTGKLLQQSAYNPRVPKRKLVQAAAAMRERGSEFLIEQDGELNRVTEGTIGSEPMIGAGVGVYTYVDSMPDLQPSDTARRGTRRVR